MKLETWLISAGRLYKGNISLLRHARNLYKDIHKATDNEGNSAPSGLTFTMNGGQFVNFKSKFPSVNPALLSHTSPWAKDRTWWIIGLNRMSKEMKLAYLKWFVTLYPKRCRSYHHLSRLLWFLGFQMN